MDSAGQSRVYGNIMLVGYSTATGTLKITGNALAWKAREGSRMVTIRAEDVDDFSWLRGSRGQQMRIGLKGSAPVRFEGFRDSDFSDLDGFLKQLWSSGIAKVNQATRGWSWGKLDVDVGTASLVFQTGGGSRLDANNYEDAFEVSLGTVSNVKLPAKNELALDMHVDDTAGREDEELVEMRFYVPEDENAEDLYNKVRAQADTSAFAGDPICSFEEMAILVPRGRYHVELYPNHIKMHGKSNDFKLLYSSITRIFVLPKPDDIYVSVVMSLDPPIRRGNTMYAHIVFRFDKEGTTTVKLAASEQELKEKYKGKLQTSEQGKIWHVFSKVLKHLSKTPLHIPKTFRTSRQKHAVRTAIGPHEGYLFFLEACFFFVDKPPTYVRYDEVDYAEFKRMDLERRFDLSISTSHGQTLLFSNIERSEFRVIFDFLESKNVVIENAAALKRSGGRAIRAALDEEGDEGSESDDVDFDPTAMEEGNQDAEDAEDAEDADFDEAGGSESDDDLRPKKKLKA